MNKYQLSIRLYGEPVGILEQMPTGKKAFTYDKKAFMAISASMPIREEPYNEQSCEAYFGGLLPESDTARQLIGKRYGVSPYNSFALLRAIGYDCAGAISCHEIDDPIISQRSVPLTGKIITDNELYEHIRELPKQPLFMDVEGLRLSLAGVQDKAAVCLINGQIAFPKNGCPTTHILKPTSSHFEGIVENEYFVMKIAKQVGLAVPEVELRRIKDITFLLIKRYDRHINNNFIERIHQEDFCQALGVLTSRKYQNEGGPSFKDCFGLLNNTTQPAIDRNRLVSVIIFNYLMGNMDAHGKNFSLIHNSNSNTRLAPFYDLVCTQAYQNLTTKMAMKIGSKYAIDDILPRHWKQLSEQINYRYLTLSNLIETLGNQIKQAAFQEKNELNATGIDHPIFNRIINCIEGNIDQTLRLFDDLRKNPGST
jgi:serine/threonine-protein kinase HipA